MSYAVEAYPNVQLAQRALAYALARLRAFNAKYIERETGPTVCRIRDVELDIDCVLIIGEAGNADQQERVNDRLESIALAVLDLVAGPPESGPAWQVVVE